MSIMQVWLAVQTLTTRRTGIAGKQALENEIENESEIRLVWPTRYILRLKIIPKEMMAGVQLLRLKSPILILHFNLHQFD